MALEKPAGIINVDTFSCVWKIPKAVFVMLFPSRTNDRFGDMASMTPWTVESICLCKSVAVAMLAEGHGANDVPAKSMDKRKMGGLQWHGCRHATDIPLWPLRNHKANDELRVGPCGESNIGRDAFAVASAETEIGA